MPEQQSETDRRLERIEMILSGMERTLRGAESEGNPGLLVRVVRLEDSKRTIYDRLEDAEAAVAEAHAEARELRREWKSFRTVTAVVAVASTFAGSATGSIIAKALGIGPALGVAFAQVIGVG